MTFVFLLVLSAKIAASMYIDTFPPETLKKQALKRSSSRMGAFVRIRDYDQNWLDTVTWVIRTTSQKLFIDVPCKEDWVGHKNMKHLYLIESDEVAAQEAGTQWFTDLMMVVEEKDNRHNGTSRYPHRGLKLLPSVGEKVLYVAVCVLLMNFSM